MSVGESGYGPQNEFCSELHRVKYRIEGETFDDFCHRIASTLADDDSHYETLLHALRTTGMSPETKQLKAVTWLGLPTASCSRPAGSHDEPSGLMAL